MEVIRIPITPRRDWHSQRNQILSQFYTIGLILGLEALSLRPLIQNLGGSAADVRQFIDGLLYNLRETADANLFNNL